MNKQDLNDKSESNLHAIDYWQVLKNRYGSILLASIITFATAAIITYVTPKRYKSSCVIEIHNPRSNPNPLSDQLGETLSGALTTRNYMQTQFELITAERTLQSVSNSLDLTALWNNEIDQTVTILKSIVKAKPKRGTDLVEIVVEHNNREECKQIANEVAATYKRERELTERERVNQSLSALDSELQLQEEKVYKKREFLNTIVQAHGITYIEDSKNNSQFGEQESMIYKRGILSLEDLKKNKRSLESQIKTLTGKTDKDLISTAAGLNIVESRVPKLYEQLVTNERELIGFKTNGYGVRHPRMVAALATNRQLKRDVQVAVTELRDTLLSRLELVQADLEAQKKVVDENKNDAVEKSLGSHDYAEAKRAYEQEKALFETMQLQHSSQRIKIKMPKNTMTVYERAKKPIEPSFPNVRLNLAVGAILGLIVGIGLAFFIEFTDTSIKSLSDVEDYLKVPVLAVIPKDIELLHTAGGNLPDAEAYRILRTNIEFNRKDPTNNCITIVSGSAGEGKSTTLMNLAFVCAQGGYSTLIIDADLRRPRLHTYFDINNSVGLTNYLTTDLQLEDVIMQTSTENLYFMPSGVVAQDASGILNSVRMSELISSVKEHFDLILIDSPPILGVSDASVISSEVGQTMIVVQHRKLPRNMLMRVKQAVENVGGDIIGVVLNNVDIKSDTQYQYYTSYYTYYSPTDEKEYQLTQNKGSGKNSNSQTDSTKEDLTKLSKEDSLY